MRFCKVAIFVATLTIISSGCASQQRKSGYRTRTYHRPASQQQVPQRLQPTEQYHQEYEADPPAPLPSPAHAPEGPSQPVPAPPATDVSLKKVQGVSFSQSCSTEPTCALPTEVCTPDEGCQKPKNCIDNFWDKSKSFCILSRLYPKKSTTSCAADSCGTVCGDNSKSVALEGCQTRNSCLPKFSMTSLVPKCFRKKTYSSLDGCVPTDDGCTAVPHCAQQPATNNSVRPFYRQSPLAEPLEDPFTQPAPIQRHDRLMPATPQPPTAVPDVPTQQDQLRPVESTPDSGNGLGDAQPANHVPPAPSPNTLTPMPSGDQTYVEPSIWPRLRTPTGRVANARTSQTSWGQNTQNSNRPVWSNPSPWSTSWQIR